MLLIAIRSEDPPYERKRSGIPVIGIIPITIPTLIKKWNKKIANNPDAM